MWIKKFLYNLPQMKHGRVVFGAVVCSILVLVLFSGVVNLSIRTPNASLHLLVPATSSNVNLCRLMLSAAVLRYPLPILINWGATENKEDAYIQHLAKVETILNYLEVLFHGGKEDDLVLIVDGYDIHFQLPPEVMIRRYYEANEAANKRTRRQVGVYNAASHDLKQTVIFGHDKLCWPMGWERPACWVVPKASDPKYAYGPYTDQSPDARRNRARWLNSGTIMGPVGDVREVFKATLHLIHTNHTTDSDQFYFANIFANQEYARRLLQPDSFKDVEGQNVNWPTIEPGEKTEYYIGIDYEATLFQTMAFFRETLTWMTFDGMRRSPETAARGPPKVLTTEKYYDKVLPDDIATSRPPFSALAESSNQEQGSLNLPTHLSWKDMKLGINAISNQIFPLLHFTGPKEFRELWWDRMWFYPYGEGLLRASVLNRDGPISKMPIGGSIWWNSGTGSVDKAAIGEKGGAIADNGAFLSWDGLCRTHEPKVFGA